MKKQIAGSIRRKISVTLIIFLVIQTIVFFVLIIPTGIMRRVYDQSYSNFNFQVLNRAGALQEFLNSARSGFVPLSRQINNELRDYFERESVEPEALHGQMEIINEALSLATSYLTEYLNSTAEVSGAFVIMNGQSDKKPAVYLRDTSLVTGANSNGSKIFVWGAPEIAQEYAFQLHYRWEPFMDFSYLTETGGADFFDMPLVSAAQENVNFEDMFYWSRPFKFADDEQDIITLSMPLLTRDGTAYAVCGVEISSEYLSRNLPYNELGDEESIYALGDEGIYSVGSIFATGPRAELLFESGEVKGLEKMESSYDLYSLKKMNGEIPEYLCVTDDIQIYNRTSIFFSEKWALYGLKTQTSLENYPRAVFRSILITQALVFSGSFLYILLLTDRISRPIARLAGLVKKARPDEALSLPRSKIKEIDELTGELEFLSKEIKLSASRLAMIVDMVGVSIGGFEERMDERKVYVTDSLGRMFKSLGASKEIDYEQWMDFLISLKSKKEPGYENVYEVEEDTNAEPRWYRLKTIKTEGKVIGFVMDVSEEIKEMNRIEYERDHDSLTKLLNRRAFLDKVNEMIGRLKLERAAVLLLDLDNLKYVNDTFGHEYGDKYIRLMADGIKGFEKAGGIVSRMAGDEFTVFLPGDKTNDSLRECITSVFNEVKALSFQLPNGEQQRIRFSTGISWYPGDSEDLDTLIRYADFAMYETKHNIKGTVGEFDLDVYNDKSFIHNKVDMLDMLIEGDYLRFMLQPIVEAATGEVIGYEALMRSELEGLKTPHEILSLARSQSKLYYIEKLCLKRFGGFVIEHKDELKGKTMFFNSIPFIAMKEDDWEEIVSSYGGAFQNAVMELAETEDILEAETENKIERFRELGCKLAIGEFGFSASGELLLLKTRPDFVKLSTILIRDINYDLDKQQLVKDSIRYCRDRNIRTMADGVETYEELRILIALGVDYLKGFYIGRPKYELKDVADKIKEQIIDLGNRL